MRDVKVMRFVIAFGLGLAVGGLTLVFQGVLPGASNQLANSGAVWCAAAFAAGAWLFGAAAPWPAAVGGLLTLWGAVVGYYGSTTAFHHDDVNASTLRGPLLWLLVACVAGPLSGLAGRAYRANGRWAMTAAAGLGAVFIAEGLYLGVALGYRVEAAVFAAIGVAIPLALGRTGRDRRRGLVALGPTVAVGGVAMGGVYLLARLILG